MSRKTISQFLYSVSESPMKYPPDNCPFDHLSFYPFVCPCEVFSRSPCMSFLSFLDEVRVPSDLKTDSFDSENLIFWKNILFWGFWAKKAKNGQSWPKFIFLGKTFNVFGSIGGQNRHKIRFSMFLKIWHSDIFWFLG